MCLNYPLTMRENEPPRICYKVFRKDGNYLVDLHGFNISTPEIYAVGKTYIDQKSVELYYDADKYDKPHTLKTYLTGFHAFASLKNALHCCSLPYSGVQVICKVRLSEITAIGMVFYYQYGNVALRAKAIVGRKMEILEKISTHPAVSRRL